MTEVQRVTTLPQPPRRPADSHKGTFGRVLIVAGSRGMSGAAVLCGQGALRGGAGLVYVATPELILPIVAAGEPSFLTLPMLDDDGQLARGASGQFDTAMSGKNAAAIGPGLGSSKAVNKFVDHVHRTCPLPMVLDADALNAFAALKTNLREAAGPRILTPHPGEFARLCGRDITEIQANRETLAVEFAAQAGVVLVLKGAGTIVTDGNRVFTNTTGNSGMSTGGTGDVLTGLIASLLAQGMTPFAAAQLGVFLHGRAGDLAADELSQPGLIASDLPLFLAKAWRTL